MPTLLLADPDVGERNARVAELERRAWIVTVCDTGAETRRALEREVFDLVVVELYLPEIDGFEILMDAPPAARDWPLWVTRERWAHQETFAITRMARHLGADGVLERGMAADAFADAIDHIARPSEASGA